MTYKSSFGVVPAHRIVENVIANNHDDEIWTGIPTNRDGIFATRNRQNVVAVAARIRP